MVFFTVHVLCIRPINTDREINNLIICYLSENFQAPKITKIGKIILISMRTFVPIKLWEVYECSWFLNISETLFSLSLPKVTKIIILVSELRYLCFHWLFYVDQFWLYQELVNFYPIWILQSFSIGFSSIHPEGERGRRISRYTVALSIPQTSRSPFCDGSEKT